MFNYAKLRGKIREVFGTQSKFAEAMEMSYSGLSSKLNNSADWTRDEMMNASKLLGFPLKEIIQYFFSEECSETRTNNNEEE